MTGLPTEIGAVEGEKVRRSRAPPGLVDAQPTRSGVTPGGGKQSFRLSAVGGKQTFRG